MPSNDLKENSRERSERLQLFMGISQNDGKGWKQIAKLCSSMFGSKQIDF